MFVKAIEFGPDGEETTVESPGRDAVESALRPLPLPSDDVLPDGRDRADTSPF
jgi:hypothetical protein